MIDSFFRGIIHLVSLFFCINFSIPLNSTTSGQQTRYFKYFYCITKRARSKFGIVISISYFGSNNKFSSMKVRYVRVSTPSQKYERQLKKEHPNEILYIDVCSGSEPFNKRPKGKELIQNKDITYVSVHAIDRLGRNLEDILQTLKHFNDNNIILKIDNLGLESRYKDKPNQAFKLIISVMGNIAEMEREMMLERQREGIEDAKARGEYKGRVRGSKEGKEVFLKKYPKIIKELKTGTSLRKTAKLHDVSLGTVQKVKKYLDS